MANSPQARKRAQQSKLKGKHNAAQRSRMRTFIKRVIRAISDNNIERANAEFKTTMAIIDSYVNKKLIKRNKAARHKRRLNARIKNLALAAATTPE